MKLVLQIPCYNEEGTLPAVLEDIAKMREETDCKICKAAVIQVVDDGSTDRTLTVAENYQVERVICNPNNLGLARTFRVGAERAVDDGFDLLINLDGDNQYSAFDIPLLVKKYLESRADIVVGCRPILKHNEFSVLKKGLQILGSAALRYFSKTDVKDAASGFRLYSARYLKSMRIYTKFSYCMETLIDAGSKGYCVESQDIRVNAKTRESRLFKSKREYIRKQLYTMLIVFSLHQPLRFYFISSLPFIIFSCVLMVRFLLNVYVIDEVDVSRTFLPSLIVGSLSFTTGVVLLMLGMLAEVMRLAREERS